MVLEIIKYPDRKLAQISQKAAFDTDLKALVQNMLDTINSFKDPQAAGLSAIQVGFPVRVLIARDLISNKVDGNGPHEVFKDIVLINPKFVSYSNEEELDWEGCLSFPDLYGKVWRARKVKLKYQNLQGEEQRLTATNFLARVIQHEMDHLDGVTFNTKIVGKTYKGDELEKGVTVAD
jgi:peptide deformylase